jgi:hypothetical protein
VIGERTLLALLAPSATVESAMSLPEAQPFTPSPPPSPSPAVSPTRDDKTKLSRPVTPTSEAESTASAARRNKLGKPLPAEAMALTGKRLLHDGKWAEVTSVWRAPGRGGPMRFRVNLEGGGQKVRCARGRTSLSLCRSHTNVVLRF